MKGSLFWKFTYVCCALAGILAGYGVFSLTGVKENREDISTKDSTLVRESGDSVFFTEEPDVSTTSLSSAVAPVGTLEPTVAPNVTATVTAAVTLAPAKVPSPTQMPALTESLPELPEVTLVPEKTASDGQADVVVQEELLPSLGSRWLGMGTTVVPRPEAVNVAKETPEEQKETDVNLPQTEIQEAFTYPAKIFGQTPVINRSDTYVSYFEFCYDLIAMIEPEVTARGLNLNALMTKFVLKALFCGVDIEKLNINAPMPRRLAALCLWLAAQVLHENGWDTSSKSAEQYVTDISCCSSSEKKAVAYLYEQGIIKGYQIPGQKFYPEQGLQTGTGEAWISGVKQCWK